MLAIIDYKMGNLRSVSKAVEKVGFKAVITNKAAEIRKSEAIILPGVGAFDHAMSNLKKLGIIDAIRKEALNGKPLLGICLGAQILFSESEEGSKVEGFGLIKGKVKKLRGLPKGLKIPHMGWNKVRFQIPDSRFQILQGIPDKEYFYFAHSYYCKPDKNDVIIGTTTYGKEIAVFVGKDNVYGMQFHPEKSGDLGLSLLKNFCKL